MDWVDGETMPKWFPDDQFITDLAEALVYVHDLQPNGRPDTNMFKIADSTDLRFQRSWFTCEALAEFDKIRNDLTDSVVLHGDLWNENIIIENGKFKALIDWEHSQMGDPHWEFRMIRRFIGWDGLDKLLFRYNDASGRMLKLSHIKSLDKLALCHQFNFRVKRNDSKQHLFLKYMKEWPECINDISN